MTKRGFRVSRAEDRARFVDLAQKRVTRALKDIQLIGNLSNRSNYDYSEADVARILKALTDEIAVCRRRFEASFKRTSRPPFKLE